MKRKKKKGRRKTKMQEINGLNDFGPALKTHFSIIKNFEIFFFPRITLVKKCMMSRFDKFSKR